jgi:hypothetical protein
MSINSSESLSSSGSYIFRDHSVSGGSSNSLEETLYKQRKEDTFNDLDNYDFYSLSPSYVIPVGVVKSSIFEVHQKINELLEVYEQFLSNVYINPYLDSDIEEAHVHLFEEVKKNYPELFDQYAAQAPDTMVIQIVDENGNPVVRPNSEIPDYVSFEQYLYAENHGCRGCRKFVKEYDRLISHSVFVHLFDFRYYLKLILNESNCIRNSLLYDFGGEYEDESQEQTAAFYYSWAKMAENHTRLLTEELTREGDKLPTAEVDILSKKQSAQFQAFFSIRVASYSEAIDNTLFSIKKDLVDTCNIFYERYVSPSLRFKTQVAAPLELDIQTTNMSTRLPFLSEEVITAVNAFKGNFGSLLSDMVQRRGNLTKKFNKILSLNLQRRKYISYIDQLSNKGSSRPKIIASVSEDNYKAFFQNLFIDPSTRESLRSSHANLDDLEMDHHPQYLLRSGGTIFGDIIVEDGVTIDGVDISAHAHTGDDGSVKIKSTDIDFDEPREDSGISNTFADGVIQVQLAQFNAAIRQGGSPVVDAVIEINIPDEIKDIYEFEILYKES